MKPAKSASRLSQSSRPLVVERRQTAAEIGVDALAIAGGRRRRQAVEGVPFLRLRRHKPACSRAPAPLSRIQAKDRPHHARHAAANNSTGQTRWRPAETKERGRGKRSDGGRDAACFWSRFLVPQDENHGVKGEQHQAGDEIHDPVLQAERTAEFVVGSAQEKPPGQRESRAGQQQPDFAPLRRASRCSLPTRKEPGRR